MDAARVARALWAAARGAQYAGASSLAAEALPPEEYDAGEAVGAMVVADLLRGTALRISATAAGSNPQACVRAAAGEARASSAFVVLLEGPGGEHALALSSAPASCCWRPLTGCCH
jgi:hypothetical protein